MINRITLLRNIGQFDSVAGAANISLARLTVMYAENGRGKTTLGAVFRSLATGDSVPIAERHRLSAQHPPHIVLDCDGGPSPAVFMNGAWSRILADMAVFDDLFVDQNVYSGLTVEAGHRQNLHELIIGAQGVALNRQLQQFVARIEEHNTALRTKAAAIPASERGNISVDEFCALSARSDINQAIQDSERALAAAREQDPIRNASLFETLSLPAFDIASINSILQENLSALDTAAAARVQAHIAGLGSGAETWINDGMRRLAQSESGASTATCPFCAQDIAGSSVITHYRTYFSEAYTNLKRKVSEAIVKLNQVHSGDVPAAFERSVRFAVERRQFWSRFCDVPELSIDTAVIVRDWRTAHKAIASVLAAKQAAPLERITLASEIQASVATYETHRQRIAALGRALAESNSTIRVVKEKAATANPQAIASDLARLKATKARHTPVTSRLCDDYLAEKAAKTRTEQQRDQARAALEQYRTNVFPAYQTAVNLYLQRFNAGFRLDSVTSTNTRGGPACTYSVVINNTPVQIAGGSPSPGMPSFRNTLSAGDRNALALAFFFASLDQDPSLANKIVVIDDPISSLDDHRSLTTVQETRRLSERAGQVIVLSHNKPFLCRIWERADRLTRSALQLVRDGDGSIIQSWEVEQDCISEHDKRHAMLRAYLAANTPNNREVARSIRPLLEAFLRVACPEHFPPGTLLGPFLNICEQRMGTPQQILDRSIKHELSEIVEYANKFHHDTNQAWETEAINDSELRGFVERALGFAKR